MDHIHEKSIRSLTWLGAADIIAERAFRAVRRIGRRARPTKKTSLTLRCLHTCRWLRCRMSSIWCNAAGSVEYGCCDMRRCRPQQLAMAASFKLQVRLVLSCKMDPQRGEAAPRPVSRLAS